MILIVCFVFALYIINMTIVEGIIESYLLV